MAMRVTLDIPDDLTTWIKDRARYEETTFEAAAIASMGDWKAFCEYPAEVEASLKLAAVADEETAAQPVAPREIKGRIVCLELPYHWVDKLELVPVHPDDSDTLEQRLYDLILERVDVVNETIRDEAKGKPLN